MLLLGLGDDHLKALQYAINNLKLAVQNFYSWYAEEDEDLSIRSQIYNGLRYQLQKRINDLSVNLGGFYQLEAYSSEGKPSYVPVPRNVQKAALKYMVDLAKNLSWLENQEVERQLEIRNSSVDQIRNFILGTLTFRLKYVALGAEKGSGLSRHKNTWKISTRTCGKETTKIAQVQKYEMGLQHDFLGSVVASSTIATAAGNFTPRRGITGLTDEQISEFTINRNQLPVLRERGNWKAVVKTPEERVDFIHDAGGHAG